MTLRPFDAGQGRPEPAEGREPQGHPEHRRGMNILLVGYGRMGRLIEELAPAHGCEIASCIDVGTGDWTVPADVAVDFSTAYLFQLFKTLL